MYELMAELNAKLNEDNVPHYTAGATDPNYIYYPHRVGYIYRVRQYEGDDYASIHSRDGEFVGNASTAEEIATFLYNKHFAAPQVTDIIQEEIGRLRAFDSGVRALSDYARNLNLQALEGKIFRAYGRETETQEILRVMLRKTKSNALLVGGAGCGKTAIVENLAFYINDGRIDYLRSQQEYERAKRLGEPADEVMKPLFYDTVIYDLDIAGMVSGTKYRGEFEERLHEMLKVLERNPNIVLFIDEVHQLNDIGGSEGSSNMGQLIKPALARGTIRCIGATTDDEIKIIYNDKALARRFNRVKVLPLGGEKALLAAEKILQDYSASHGIKVEGVTSAELFDEVQNKVKSTAFPDNYINLLDETMAGAKLMRKSVVTKDDFNATISRLIGTEVVSVRIGF